MYYSAPYLREFYRRVVESVKKITGDYELVFVDDGSPDGSLAIVQELSGKDEHVTVVELSRNFGHHKAMMTGLSQSTGEWVFLIDCDLEEKPEWLDLFWAVAMESTEIDVVFGVQKKRKGGWFERISGAFFYVLFNFFSDVKIPPNLVTCRLMRKNYVRALLEFREREILIAGLWSAAGFKQKAISVEKSDKGSTTYSPAKKFFILIDSIVTFSNRPLVWIFYMGFLVTFLAFSYSGWIVYRKFVYDISIMGWASLIASLWLLGGFIIFSIGTVGLYLSKVYAETKNRPYTIIRKIHSSKDL